MPALPTKRATARKPRAISHLRAIYGMPVPTAWPWWDVRTSTLNPTAAERLPPRIKKRGARDRCLEPQTAHGPTNPDDINTHTSTDSFHPVNLTHLTGARHAQAPRSVSHELSATKSPITHKPSISVTETLQPNSMGAKLPLTHGLHMAQWEKLLDGHNDPLLFNTWFSIGLC